MVAYDLAGHKVIWTKNMTYGEQPIMQTGDLMVVSNNNFQPACLNANTGRLECALDNPVFYMNGERNLGFGLNGAHNRIRCVDMKSGTILWENKLDGTYGINDLRELNDSTVLVSAAGLHAFNFLHGGGWDYNAKTGIKDYTEEAVVSVFGVVAAAALGVGVMSYGYNLLNGLVSNTLIADSCIYFADMNRLSCFDTDGTVKWYKAFDKNVLSKSHLCMRGDTLLMLNLGYGHYNLGRTPHGYPFIAAYDRRTGDELFMCKIGVEDYPVKDFLFKENSIVILFGDKIGEYSLTNGTYISDRYFSDTGCGELTGFVSGFTFMHFGGIFVPLWDAYPDKTCVMNKEKVYIMNREMEVIDEIEYKNLYLFYLTDDEYLFMANKRETVVIDNDGIEVARFEFGKKNVFVAGHFLYEIKDNILREIDLFAFPSYNYNRSETETLVSAERVDLQDASPI